MLHCSFFANIIDTQQCFTNFDIKLGVHWERAVNQLESVQPATSYLFENGYNIQTKGATAFAYCGRSDVRAQRSDRRGVFSE